MFLPCVRHCCDPLPQEVVCLWERVFDPHTVGAFVKGWIAPNVRRARVLRNAASVGERSPTWRHCGLTSLPANKGDDASQGTSQRPLPETP
jgi:hypothetical protein